MTPADLLGIVWPLAVFGLGAVLGWLRRALEDEPMRPGYHGCDQCRRSLDHLAGPHRVRPYDYESDGAA